VSAERAEPAASVPCGDIIELLRDATGADAAWAAAIGPTTRLDGDLFLDSLAVTALAGSLQARYGARIDLLAHVAALDIDQIIELSVADVASYVSSQAVSSQAVSSQAGPASRE
jgi:acyl carrier protein